MGFSYQEVGRLYYGKWSDLFETYKKIYNMQIQQMIFQEPRKVESIMATLGGGDKHGKQKANRRNNQTGR